MISQKENPIQWRFRPRQAIDPKDGTVIAITPAMTNHGTQFIRMVATISVHNHLFAW